MRCSPSIRRPDGWSRRWCGPLAVVAGLVLAVAPAAAAPAHRGPGGPGLGPYSQRNLVSDVPGAAELTDPNLVNAWGLSFSPTSPAWVADNGTDVSTLYSGAVAGRPVTRLGLVVKIPGGAPTGTVFNGSPGFVVRSGMSSGPARFLFSSEAGTITGWSPAVPPPPPSTNAQTAITVPGAIFKGLAIADTATGPRLYATDFHHGTVDVWDANFAPVRRPGAFRDPAIPRGFAPFGIQAINGGIVVTYAKQDADAEDDVAGPGNGYVDVYDTAGTLLRRFAARGRLNSPWGVAPAPQGFGPASGAMLIGNFGDGRINAYDPVSARFLGALRDRRGQRIAIDGLWALEFGNGVIGTTQSLLFTAGPADEAHGLFGEITAREGSR
jgi:uncharacterized protein (TIGR03118 family)